MNKLWYRWHRRLHATYDTVSLNSIVPKKRIKFQCVREELERVMS